ncbi:MAG TPA: OsmC family protein [Candidatus Dormibacteraeota bacterium]|nr:OsmC family protein [Candidatus Dormibacteraeota bacterium]
MSKVHHYSATIKWTGNHGSGTSDYRAYSREHVLEIKGKPTMPCSSDRVFCGDATRYNPEELLVAALSACHMLWYLHLCSVRGIVVVDYVDNAEGTMKELADGSGCFTSVVLRPHITVVAGNVKLAEDLHNVAHKMCFIANSVNFPVRHQASVEVCSQVANNFARDAE